jgi:hypothetical protein
MKNIKIHDDVMVRESTDSKNRGRTGYVICEGPLVHVGLRTEKTWFVRSQVNPWPDYFWEPESNLVLLDGD